MSEYQFVHFLAVDRPLDDEQFSFMKSQSTRAKVSRTEFTIEYNFGSFGGKVRKTLIHALQKHKLLPKRKKSVG